MSFPNPKDYVASTARTHIRSATGRYIQQGGRWSNKLLGQSAILMIDPKAPWFVLAQFDDLNHPYWSHGWHPLPAYAFGGIQVQHVLDDETNYCLACGMTEDQLMGTAEDDCKVLDLEPAVEFKDSPDLSDESVLQPAQYTWTEVKATEIDTESGVSIDLGKCHCMSLNHHKIAKSAGICRAVAYVGDLEQPYGPRHDQSGWAP